MIENRERKRSWKLHICHRETGCFECYTVHPDVVAFGAKGSNYLARLMDGENQEKYSRQGDRCADKENFDTKQSRVTVVELNAKYAELIPYFLNFAYFYASQEDDEDILGTDGSIKTFQALYELSIHWEISALRTELAKFQTRQFTFDCALEIMTFASQFCTPSSFPSSSGDLLLDAALDWFADHISELEPQEAGAFEPLHLLQILRKNMCHGIEVRVDDFTRSQMVANCVHQNCSRLLLTKELLDQLTDEDLLPFISPRFEASVFLIAESRLSKKCNPSPAVDDDALTSLEERCIQSITTFWKSCCSGIKTTDLPSPWGGLLEESKHDEPRRVKDAMLDFFGELRKDVLIKLLEQTSKVEDKTESSYGTLAFLNTPSRLTDLLWASVEPLLVPKPDDEATLYQDECYIIEDGIMTSFFTDCSLDTSMKSSLPSLPPSSENLDKNYHRANVDGKNVDKENLDETFSLSSSLSNSTHEKMCRTNEIKIVSLVPELVFTK